MHPDGTMGQPYGGDEGPAVGRHRDPLFLGWPESNLLRLAIGKPLAPDMELPTEIRAEVHPGSVRRPGGKQTSPPRRPNRLTGRTAVHRNHAAGDQVSPL